MIWPPIRFANNTTTSTADARALAADLDAERGAVPGGARRRRRAKDAARRGPCRDLEWKWLGTDDDGHDIVARLIYGFRLSVLFGLMLAGVSSVIGVAAGAVQGYFGGWLDLVMQRVIEIWSSLPHLYILIILSAILAPSFFVLLTILLLFSWVSLVHLVRAEFLRARNFEYVNAARALGLSQCQDHRQARAAERDGGDADLPAVHRQFLDQHPDLARFSRPRHAARLAFARRIAAAGQVQPVGAWLGLSAFVVSR